MSSTQSIYHKGSERSRFGRTIRLNLRAVRQLLCRPSLRHFRELSERDRELLQSRFSIYCRYASPDFAHTTPTGHPAINNLPNSRALRIAQQDGQVMSDDATQP